MRRRYLFSALFIVGGIVLLLTKHGLTIRFAEKVNFGWLVLGIGVLSLAWDLAKARRMKNQEAGPAKKA